MSFTYTFQESDAGKTFRLTASLKSNPSITDSILINCNNTIPIPTPSEEIGSFPEGTSSESFVLIYQLNQDYVSTLDARTLNEYAYNYLEDIKGERNENITYYAEDDEGIYLYVVKSETDNYDNEIVSINGVDCYKVYVGGTAEIIGFAKDPSETGSYSLTLSNGYCGEIANKIYLFVTNSAQLVNIVKSNGTPVGFYYETENSTNTKYFTDKNTYLEKGYYLSIGNYCTIDNALAPSSGEAINYVFADGNINAIITSDTMTELSCFADIVNAKKIVLSSNIRKIGNYCFYGSNVSGEITLETALLEEIGDYAFANMSNLKLLNINADEDGYSNMPETLRKIGNYAFVNSAGLQKISLIDCINIQEVGEQAFSNCINLRYVKYLKSQIEPDGITSTQLLYLPPEQGSDGNYAPRNTGTQLVTAGYEYNYEAATAYPATEEEKTNSKKTFLNNSNISWSCY